MPQVYDEEGPLYVVSPKGFSTVLRRAEVNLPTNEVVANPEPLQTVTRSLVYLRGEPYFSDIPPAHQIALAVLKGDTGAALLLADLVQEQHTGQASELQAEVRARVCEAVMEEREACAKIVDVKQSVSALVDHTRYELAMAIRERAPGVRALRLAAEAAEMSASMPMTTSPLTQ